MTGETGRDGPKGMTWAALWRHRLLLVVLVAGALAIGTTILQFGGRPVPVLGLLLALATAAWLVGVAVMERPCPGFRSTHQVKEELGLPTLGLVPELPRPHGRLTLSDALIDKPTSAYAEAIKSAQLAILDAKPEAGPFRILLVSSVAGEGKTSFAVSLARSLALSGHRTLLLDCDFRRPTVHRHFGSEAVPGLVDCLRQEVSYEDLIRCDERSGLYYATAGSPCRDPQKMLDSSLGTTVLHALMARFEVTIIDSPPTMVASDCVVLARGADLTLHIAAWSRTPRGAVRAGVDYLRSRGCRVAGVVLSRIDIERAGRGGDYVDYAFRPGSGYLVE